MIQFRKQKFVFSSPSLRLFNEIATILLVAVVFLVVNKNAIDWMVKASVEIDKQNHHPTWTNEYNKVHVCLTTHDEGNTITHKDRELAQALDTME